MDLVNFFKSFVSVFTTILNLSRAAATVPQAALLDPEAAVNQQMSPPGTAPIDHNQHNKLVDGAMKMICFSLPTAVAIALQPLQTKSQLPLAFHFLIGALLFSFNFLFLSNFITPKFPEIAQVLEFVGVFFAVTAIYIAITIPLPIWLKCITWTIFVISFVTIVACFYRT
ncbi:hypothetical protein Dsin_007799 [Dipteronia sinensis]|uniref:NADH dehydrogenase subunit 6 n=1 Tax=Dipteronia sinensis TaxID=43782 RepID=A0AAE0B272_9ROSI|nr:hypothetical protein Dsin_007799 [Dipteronia sinensis]